MPVVVAFLGMVLMTMSGRAGVFCRSIQVLEAAVSERAGG